MFMQKYQYVLLDRKNEKFWRYEAILVQLLMASPKDREPKVTKDFLELCENKKELNSKFSTYFQKERKKAYLIEKGRVILLLELSNSE